MSDLYEDPELERQLESAFRSTRPRRSFEDELWRNLQRRRPLSEKLGAWLGGVPWIPALATVSALAVAVFGFVFLLGDVGPRGGASSSGAAPAEKQSQQQTAADARSGATAASSPPLLAPKAFGPVPPVPATITTAYTGGLDLTLSAPLPGLPGNLPIYRYTEPTSADSAAFAGSRGAAQPGLAPEGGTAPGARFSGSSTDITVLGSDAKNLVGPTYIINSTRAAASPSSAATLTDDQAAQIATAHLRQLNLPASDTPTVRNSGPAGVQVLYPSQVDGGSGPVAEVDAQGRPVFTQVSLRGDGQVFQVSGPLPGPLPASMYTTASTATLRQLPNAPTGSARARADLSSARLVYVAVPASGGGYLAPAILFTGTFQADGRSYEVAVIVSAIDPSMNR
jgi:hypothetical protein